ncbi:MAG: M14 family metallocarboxypeptidase [Clostridia bacterium]|nr:M14 family metallocarboxypeptidase [Clostridia bacterium]
MAYVFDYAELEKSLASFRHLHPQIPVFSIGKSREGRHLYGIKLGKGGKRVFFNGAHHGMEWLTAKLLMQFAEELAQGDHQANTLLQGRSLYLVPMVNPDGVEIAAGGKEWQANAFGVDLNHNYDALWHLSKQSEKDAGIFGPGPTRFSGPFPESEPETRAVADFTRQNGFDLAIAFHSQGEVIYWDFCGFAPDKSYTIAKQMEAVSPYRMDTVSGIASFGGYKDWFIRTFKRPAFTVEIGQGKNPLPIEDLATIYPRTLPLMLEAIRLA